MVNFKDKDMKTLGIKVKKKKVSKKGISKKLDTLFSQRIRERDGVCLRCGKRDGLQCAHLISRTYKHLRCDEKNAITLCYACHIHWCHHNPIEFSEWVEKRFPKNYKYVLKEKYKDLAPPTIEELQTRLDELKAKKLPPI